MPVTIYLRLRSLVILSINGCEPSARILDVKYIALTAAWLSLWSVDLLTGFFFLAETFDQIQKLGSVPKVVEGVVFFGLRLNILDGLGLIQVCAFNQMYLL